jgi:hypothetical protein
LANTSFIKRPGQSDNQALEQNLNSSLRYSFQRRDSNLLKSQFSIKSWQSQVHHAPTRVPSHPNHPMSRYHGRSGIDRSSKYVIGGSPMYQYHKEKSLYCPSEHHSRSSAHKMAEMTPKRIGDSPKDRTNLTPSWVNLNRISSPLKSKNQYMGPTNGSMLDQIRMDKFDKRTPCPRRPPAIDHRKKSGDYLSADSTSQSNSVTSSDSAGDQQEASETSRGSSSYSSGNLGSLPIVPFQKPGHLPVVPFQKSGHLLVTRTEKPVISRHDHNKSLQRIQSTRHHKFVSSRRCSKKLAEETDKTEQKRGRFKQLKDKLAIVFHHRHDHHHYHHHTNGGGSTKRQVTRANKDHHHRSLWKYLKGIVHHSSEKTADQVVPSQHHHHRHLHALVRMLFGQFWGNKRRKKTRLGRTVSRVHVQKLQWWHRFGRGGRMKLTNSKKARLRLRYGAKGDR